MRVQDRDITVLFAPETIAPYVLALGFLLGVSMAHVRLRRTMLLMNSCGGEA